MSITVTDAAAATLDFTNEDTSGDYEAIVTVGPMTAGTLARISYWISNPSMDSFFAIYSGDTVTGDPLLVTGLTSVCIVDTEPATEYTLAYKGDQTFASVTATLSVDQLG